MDIFITTTTNTTSMNSVVSSSIFFQILVKLVLIRLHIHAVKPAQASQQSTAPEVPPLLRERMYCFSTMHLALA